MPPQPMTGDQFAGKFLKAEARGDRWLSKLMPQVQSLAMDLIAEYEAGAPLTKGARKTFVRDFVNGRAKGSVWLSLIASILIPIFQRLLEDWLLNRKDS